jgi:phosphoesterase RecJ-like protein
VNEALELLRRARRVAVVSHRDPDGDTIGSGLTLALALEQLGKTASLHCADPVPDSMVFLDGSERFSAVPPPDDVDLVVTVDHGDLSRTKLPLPPGVPILNVDHHASNAMFGTVNVVDATSAATGEMIARFVDALGVAWTPAMATATLIAIMTDTGSFQFPNTDARVHRLAARLLEVGADLPAVTYNVFRTRRFEALTLWGLAFSRLQRDVDGQLVWTWLEPEDQERARARDEDASGLVEQVARSKGMRVALLFNAIGSPGAVKISCRTSPFEPAVDAAALMGRSGGGGHARAAGAIVPGALDEVRGRVLEEARVALAVARELAPG